MNWRSFGLAALCAAATLGPAGASRAAGEALAIDITYLFHPVERPPVLSNLDPVPEDEGLAGARLGLEDNATTGRFLGHAYALETRRLDSTGAVEGGEDPGGLVLVDAPAEVLLAFADAPENAGRLIFNVRSADTALRDAECRANVLHTGPSLAMRADALSQFLVTRRWDRVAMVTGRRDADRAFAEALRRSFAKFGLTLAGEKDWVSDADLRRSAASELPPFTQDLPRHDVLIVADEAEDFARYLPYNTWEPRPVAGSEGLVPTGWSRVVESWGAAQLQSRFVELAARDMRAADYAAWVAMRAIGEAVIRTGRADAAGLRDYLLSEEFELAGFKGRKLSFRPWNGQLRQPVHLVTPRAVVADTPMEGFLHPVSEMDTLGLDAPESECRAFGAR